MKPVSEILTASTAYLEKQGVGRPRRLAEELLAAVLKLKRIDLYLQYDRPVVEEELTQVRDGVKKLAKGHPLEYLLGSLEFYGCQIRVDSRVLIPRPETELLVDLIKKKNPTGVLWDLCTGSGCIGIALKKKLPHLEVTLSDLSQEALALASDNSRLNGVEVSLLQGDLLAPFQGKKTNLVVCNPPYISAIEYEALDPSVREFEPRLALLGGERGTEFYERLSAELPQYLTPGGQVFLEIGFAQGEAVKKIFSSHFWTKQTLFQDWSGRDRFFTLEKQ